MPTNKQWYQNGSKIADALEELKTVSDGKTFLDTKTKELIKFVVASISRCDHCTTSHLKKALAAGATKEELTEALLIGSLQTAATQMNWDKEVFERYLGKAQD
jgi:AhpD family alkylhydroperoxidase